MYVNQSTHSYAGVYAGGDSSSSNACLNSLPGGGTYPGAPAFDGPLLDPASDVAPGVCGRLPLLPPRNAPPSLRSKPAVDDPAPGVPSPSSVPRRTASIASAFCDGNTSVECRPDPNDGELGGSPGTNIKPRSPVCCIAAACVGFRNGMICGGESEVSEELVSRYVEGNTEAHEPCWATEP